MGESALGTGLRDGLGDVDRATLLADAEDLTGSGSYKCDLDSGCVRWSPGMYRLHGIEAGSRLRADGATGVDDRDRARVRRAVDDALAGDLTTFDVSCRIVRPGGEVRWLETRNRVGRDTTGRPVRLSGVSIDVTARRERPPDLIEAGAERDEPVDAAVTRQRPRQLSMAAQCVEISGDIACSVGFDGFLKELNGAWTRTLGWSEDELRSRPLMEFVHPDDRQNTEREIAAHQKAGERTAYDNRLETKDGGWTSIAWTARSVVDEGTTYAVGRDISERVRVVAALGESRRQAAEILETSLDAFISLDEGGLITAWNARAEAVFGWPAADVLGRELAEVLIPEVRRESHRRGIERFAAVGESRMLGRRLEMMVLHRDGYEFLVEMAMSALDTADGYVFNAFLRDITERRRVEGELALARDQALEASRMKSMFVANMSHEIRTPMNGVIGMTELLLETELDDVQREYAETISSSGDTLLALIDDILDLSKVEAGKLELDPTDFDLPEAIERASGLLAARAHAKGIQLRVVIDPGTPTHVHGDVGRMRQVVVNLLSNAVKFTPAGEVVIRVGGTPDGDDRTHLRVAVIDSGIGIDREALKRLFTPFEQADYTTTRKYGGTGLGLAISRQLVALMGGTVGAESEVGRGSTFWFELSLPLAHEEIKAVLDGGRRATVSGSPGNGAEDPACRSGPGPLVLVVEDTHVNQVVAARMLESFGYRPEIAENGLKALEALSGASFAAVLMDCQMPELDGYETTQQIRRLERPGHSRIPIIAMTANSMDGERERCLAAGMDDYLTKPLRKLGLSEILGRWIPELPAATVAQGTSSPEARHTAPRPVRDPELPEPPGSDSVERSIIEFW